MPEKKLNPADIEILLTNEQEKASVRAERIRLHFETNEYITDQDLRYYQQLEQVFNFAFGYERTNQVCRLIQTKFRIHKRQALQMLEDCQVVFGQFFEVNKKAKRHLQELKLNHLYELAMVEKDIEQCRLILGEINRLYNLYDDSMDYIDNAGRKLPQVTRSSDPQLLNAADEEE